MKTQVLVPMRVAPLAWSPAFLTGHTHGELLEVAMSYKDRLIYQAFRPEDIVYMPTK